MWEPDALGRLAAAFHDPQVGYACGQVCFVNDQGTNQEGLYWRYEMWLREHESALASVTAGNGAIYALRPELYEPVEGHDLALPFMVVKRGRRAVYVPQARASEKMVPTVEGEWARKRRMMTYAWPIVVRGGLLDPRGYRPLYALMMASHRLLRYATPVLHVAAAAATLALLPRGRTYALAAAVQGGDAGCRLGRRPRPRPAAARRPLLRAHDRRPRRRSVRLAPLRHAGRLGGPRRHAMTGASYLSSRRKRALDLLLGGCALLLSAPVLAACVVAIRLETHGHPVHRQRRVGRDEAPFQLYKLRTMVSGAETMGKGLAVDEGDDRITRLGAWLRRTSFDEVPNLVNVLRGEMSLAARARPCRSRSTATTSASAAGSTRCPGSPAGRRSTAAPRCRGTSGSSLNLSVRRAPASPPARPAHPRPHRSHGDHRPRAVSRRDRGLARDAAVKPCSRRCDEVERGRGEAGDAEDYRRGGRRLAHHGLERLQPAGPARPRAARQDPGNGARPGTGARIRPRGACGQAAATRSGCWCPTPCRARSRIPPR